MNALEDRIRAAARAAADTVPADSAPPLRLPGDQARRPRPVGLRNWRRTGAPLAAAAAVIAIVAASLTVARPAHNAAHLPGGAVALGEAPAYRGGDVPPYYVALEPGALSGASTRAVVRATATGAELAVVTPPRPYHVFTAVSAAADDSTFVLAAQRNSAAYGPPSAKPGLQKYFLLRLDRADHTARMTALPIPGEPGGQVIDEALAPDGSKLAIALATGGQELEIKVISLRTGSVRTWRGSDSPGTIGEVVQSADPLSWTADGHTLAFEVITGSTDAGPLHQIRLLDTTAPGSSLWSSRVAVRFGSDAADAMITPDGSRIVVPVVTQTTREFAEYSVTTGKQVAVLGIRHYVHANYGGWPLLFWADPAGGTLIVYDDRPHGPQLTKTGEPDAGVLAVVAGSRFTQLPGTDEQGAW